MKEPYTEFDYCGTTERDNLLEYIELAETDALDELEAFGNIEMEPNPDWREGEATRFLETASVLFDIIEAEGEDNVALDLY